MDVGSGAFASLQERIEYTDVDAIVISHMHADHFLDIVPYWYGLKYGPLVRDRRLPLWLPPGDEALLRAMCRAFSSEGPRYFLDEVFEVREYDPSGAVEVGDMRPDLPAHRSLHRGVRNSRRTRRLEHRLLGRHRAVARGRTIRRRL